MLIPAILSVLFVPTTIALTFLAVSEVRHRLLASIDRMPESIED